MPSSAPQPSTPVEDTAHRTLSRQGRKPDFRSRLRGGHFSIVGVSPSFREEDTFLALGTSDGLAILAGIISGKKIVPATLWQIEHGRV